MTYQMRYLCRIGSKAEDLATTSEAQRRHNDGHHTYYTFDILDLEGKLSSHTIVRLYQFLSNDQHMCNFHT